MADVKDLVIRLEESISGIWDMVNSDADIRLKLGIVTWIGNTAQEDELYLSNKSFIVSYKIAQSGFGEYDKGLVKFSEGKRLVAESKSFSEALAGINEIFSGFEETGKTVSCRGMDYFNMHKFNRANSLYVIERGIHLSPTYHTDDARFDSFRKGSFLS